MRLHEGDTVEISENLKSIYEARGWNYIPESHDKIISKTGTIRSIEDKYCYDYCYVAFEDDDYSGTLPIQALIKANKCPHCNEKI